MSLVLGQRSWRGRVRGTLQRHWADGAVRVALGLARPSGQTSSCWPRYCQPIAASLRIHWTAHHAQSRRA
eukprot:9359885-Lingulodinium_polyedra.AAC.1